MLKDLSARPIRPEDIPLLEKLRRMYWDADLEIPKGYTAEGVATIIVDKGAEFICSVTGTQAVVIDPLIRNPNVSGPDLVAAIWQAERILSFLGQRGGAVDAYIAVPSQLKDYHRIVEKAGYKRTCESCVIFRRPLRPDTEPLLGAERAAQELNDRLNPSERIILSAAEEEQSVE